MKRPLEDERRVRQGRALDLLTLAIAVCALAMTGLAARSYIKGRALPRGGPTENREITSWPELTSSGNRIGPSDADVVIVTFYDYRCRFCRRVEGSLRWVREAFPQDVAVLYRHLPLLGDPSHHFARLAGCAATQDRFEEVHPLLFETGISPEAVTEAADPPDRSEFERCATSPDPVPQIEWDIRTAEALGITAVPAVILDGTLLGPPPDSSTLMELVRKRLERRTN